jgi:hypothetical protein
MEKRQVDFKIGRTEDDEPNLINRLPLADEVMNRGERYS